MKVSRVETLLIAPRFALCRVETDDGLVGWGEPVLEGRAEVVLAAVEAAAELLIGQDPTQVVRHWQTLTKGSYYRNGPILASAVSGLDQALWDIFGKAVGLPVHALLGGAQRDRTRVYAWLHGADTAALVDHAQLRLEQGYTAVKLAPARALAPLTGTAAVREIVDRVAAVRSAIGDDVDLMIDLHGRATLPQARILIDALAPLKPLFVEEPVRPELVGRLDRVTSTSSVPIAMGERLYARHEFLRVLEAGAAVVQPDLSHAGGITEARRIADLAEMFDAAFAPHCPLGPVTLASSLQVDAVAPTFLIQEQSIDIHAGRSDALSWLVDTTPLRPIDGSVPLLTGPGLGLEIDEASVREAARDHRFRSPIWHRSDGSFTEW